jgi:hypothetical protein
VSDATARPVAHRQDAVTRRILLALLGAASAALCVTSVDRGEPASQATIASPTFPQVLLLHLDSGPFPGNAHPQTAVYVPPGFDPSAPVDLLVYLHGWHGRAENTAWWIGNALAGSPRNALVVVPQLAWDAPSSADGTFAQSGGFERWVTEVLQKLPPPIGPRGLGDLGEVVLASHSGGYVAAADILDHGGLNDHVTGVILLDTVYSRGGSFEAWVADRLQHGQSARLVDLYIHGSPTEGPSHALAAQVRTTLGTAARGQLVDVVDPRAALSSDDLAHSYLFKAVHDPHNDLPPIYLGRLVDSSLLPGIGSEP